MLVKGSKLKNSDYTFISCRVNFLIFFKKKTNLLLKKQDKRAERLEELEVFTEIWWYIFRTLQTIVQTIKATTIFAFVLTE